VAGARNGREALEYLGRRTLPSLILLDMIMPEMDGWLFRREQQKRPDLASIPVVILSSHGDVRDAALLLGVADYLRKPLRLDSLLEIAERYCRPIFLN
jgi:CheY-like chemotaxis protein